MAEDPENEERLREIPASEILDKIQKGEPVEYDHVRIMGDLDLGNLDLLTEHVARTEYQIKSLELPEESKVVSSSIEITDSKFDAKVNFGNNLFTKSITFDNTIFSGDVGFDSATFGKDAGFRRATFGKDTWFGSTTFSGVAGFNGATFSGVAWFDSATFGEDAGFDSATFSGDARFDRATFSGDARFRRATFSKDAWFDSATFSGDAGFDSATFSGDARFRRATFSKDAWFNGATFSKDAWFNGATFSKDARFDRATFGGVAGFDSATFSKDAWFNGATFSGDARFRRATFGGVAGFDSATFSGVAGFNGATFGGVAGFNGATFGEDARFRRATFGEDAGFDSATFSGDAGFDSATFSGDARFRRATFSKDATFTCAYFNKNASFNATFCRILNLDESKIYSMHLSNAIFKNASTISLRFSDFVRLEVRWKSIQGKVKYDGSAFLALVKNFNNLEFFNDADECYYYYRTIRRREHLNAELDKSTISASFGPFGVATDDNQESISRDEIPKKLSNTAHLNEIIIKLLDYVAWVAYGYGVHPRNPLILSLVLFLFSIFVFALGFRLQEPLESMVNATYLSVFVFTSSPKTDPLTGFYGVWGMIERIAGWLLMSCFLVVLAKKTLR